MGCLHERHLSQPLPTPTKNVNMKQREGLILGSNCAKVKIMLVFALKIFMKLTKKLKECFKIPKEINH